MDEVIVIERAEYRRRCDRDDCRELRVFIARNLKTLRLRV